MRKKETRKLLPILRQYIRPGTTVITDDWRAYRRLSEGGELQHRVLDHFLNFVSPEDSTVYTRKRFIPKVVTPEKFIFSTYQKFYTDKGDPNRFQSCSQTS